MGDFRSEISILAWPVNRRAHIPVVARAELRSDGITLDGQTAASGASGCLRRRSDADGGGILEIKDPSAKGGLERYRQLIEALSEGGLYVYAVDGGCEDYHPEWEYHSPGTPRVARGCNSAGETTVSAREVLDACRQADATLADSATVADVDGAALGEAVRLLFCEPPVPTLR